MFDQRISIDEYERRLTDLESRISELRAQQGVIVNELAKIDAHRTDASRSLVEWVQARLDMDLPTARDLVYLGRRGARHRRIWAGLERGRASFARTVLTMRYADAGASDEDIERSGRRDLAGMRRLLARRTRMTRSDERAVHEARYLAIQPTLDESRYRLHGDLSGAIGRMVVKAIDERADELRITAGDLPTTRGRLRADALASIAEDSLDGRAPDGDPGASAPTVTIFVDATVDDPPEKGSAIAFGPRVGPDTLERLLCDGTVRVVGLDGGRPVVASHATRAIPTAVRHAVMRRDGGCTIDGCRSRYRLQPHHIHGFADGGRHDPDNLTTLCWYHHHVAIHGSGFRIDPDSPPLRRRLVRPRTGPDPPRPPW